MSHRRLAVALLLALAAAGCTAPDRAPAADSPPADAAPPPPSAAARDTPAARFVLDTAAVHVAELWTGDTTALARLRADTASPRPDALLLAHGREGDAVLRLTRWSTGAAAEAHAARAAAVDPAPARTRVFRVARATAREGEALAVATGEALQWSEFLMKRPAALDTLLAIVGPMTAGMTSTRPTLRWVAPMRSADAGSLALLGEWSTPEGFEVFTRENTFGATPYWAPYAENEHWMMRVVAARAAVAP